jgi:hypothetical protein
MADIAECKDNHICFYSEPDFRGNLESYDETVPIPGNCKNLSKIGAARSIMNRAIIDVRVYQDKICPDDSGEYIDISPGESRPDVEPLDGVRSYVFGAFGADI